MSTALLQTLGFMISCEQAMLQLDSDTVDAFYEAECHQYHTALMVDHFEGNQRAYGDWRAENEQRAIQAFNQIRLPDNSRRMYSYTELLSMTGQTYDCYKRAAEQDQAFAGTGENYFRGNCMPIIRRFNVVFGSQDATLEWLDNPAIKSAGEQVYQAQFTPLTNPDASPCSDGRAVRLTPCED